MSLTELELDNLVCVAVPLVTKFDLSPEKSIQTVLVQCRGYVDGEPTTVQISEMIERVHNRTGFLKFKFNTDGNE